MSESKMDIDHVVDSKLAKTINKIVLPALATIVLGIVTWLAKDMWTESKAQSASLNAMKVDFTQRLQATENKVDLLNAKVDQGVLWRIGEIERRLNQVEQAQKTP